MNVNKLHEVIHEIRFAQTWCDSDGTHTACVSVSKGKLREWAAKIEDALEYQIAFEDHGEHETCHETMIDRFFRGCSECGYIWEFMYGIGNCVRPNYCPNCGKRVVE